MALTRWSGIAFGSCLRKVGCFGLLSIIATRKPLVMAELARPHPTAAPTIPPPTMTTS
jgi:hypothetical protein